MKTERKPFLPVVSAEEFCAFRTGRPETYTASTLVNAVCEAFEKCGYADCISVANYLKLNRRKLSIAIEILTGHTLAKMRQKLVDDRIVLCRQEHPDWSAEQVAYSLGFVTNTAIWHRIKDDRLPVSYKPKKRKLTREEIIARLEEELKGMEPVDERTIDKFIEEMGKSKK